MYKMYMKLRLRTCSYDVHGLTAAIPTTMYGDRTLLSTATIRREIITVLALA